MNKRFYFTTAILLVAYLLSACGGTLQPAEQPSGEQAAVKVQAVEVAFTGVVEAMHGNKWTVNGQVLSVEPAVVRDGPFQAGDTIKVEGTVNVDGSLSISRVEAPTVADLTALPQLGNDNVNNNDANANDANLNSNDGNVNANINDDNSNSANANANSNDDNSNSANANANSNDDNSDAANANINSNDDHANNGNTNSSDNESNSNSNSNDDDGDDSGGENENDSGGHDNDDDDNSNDN